MKMIYLDYASSTPVDRRVFSAMKPYFSERFYNAAALYKEGVEARKVVDAARSRIAKILNARAKNIIFTGSGTESVNLALVGTVRAFKHKHPEVMPHIITSVVEHPATLEACRMLEMEALAKVTYVSVNEDGLVSPKDIEDALSPETVLVSIMYANNEIGTVQPIKEIARRVKLWKLHNKREENDYPFVHTDASQAANYVSLDREKLGIDMMTLDGQKIYGPKGVGILFAKSDVSLAPIIYGGGQEKGLRSGTENVAAIIGMAEALEITQTMREKESARLAALQTYFFDEIKKNFSEMKINGSVSSRIPNNINICIPRVNAEFLVLEFDAKGIACASVSACKNLNDESASHVIDALPHGGECSRSSLRFSLGRNTSKSDLKKVLKLLPELVSKAHF